MTILDRQPWKLALGYLESDPTSTQVDGKTPVGFRVSGIGLSTFLL